MPLSRPSSASRLARRLGHVGLAAAVVLCVGCQGGTGILRRWKMQSDPTLAKPISASELGDNRNMVARWLTPEKAPHTDPGRVQGVLALKPQKPDPETEAKIKEAESLYQQGRLAEAEKAFARLDRVKIPSTKSKDKIKIGDPAYDVKDDVNGFLGKLRATKLASSMTRYTEPPWGEKILFYLAECQYQQGKFFAAHDTYEKMLNTYSGSPHLEKAIEREWAIAQDWLAAGEAAKPPAADKPDPSGSAVKEKDASVHTASWTDHFNGRLPLMDVDGYALKVLEHVRQHDATGPLADDATLRIAEYYFNKGDYENASAYYDQFIAEYPKSDLLQKAQLGSIDSKLKGYLGPDYDSDGLEQARLLIEQTKTTFPIRQASTTDKLQSDLAKISGEQAEIAFRNGQFYKNTGYASGAEYYFGEVVARWPGSPLAAKAKTELAALAKAPRKVATPSKILTLPGAPDPNAMGNSMGSMATMPGGGMGGGSPGAGP